MLDFVATECLHLESIDIGKQDIDKVMFEAIEPIFDKFKKCKFTFTRYVDEQKLENLFSRNNQLEHLEIERSCGLFGFFLDALPFETIKELHLHSAANIPFDSICQVNIFNKRYFSIWDKLNFINFSFFPLKNRLYKIVKIFKACT